MIDLHNVWIPQILSHAGLVAETETLRRAWVDGDRSQTSVTGLDELIEQVFDDSDSEEMLERARVGISDKRLFILIEEFIKSLKVLEQNCNDLSPPSVVLNSPEWKISSDAAKNLVSFAKGQG